MENEREPASQQLLEAIQEYLKRDHELRSGFLKSNERDRKFRKIRTWLMALAIALGPTLYILTVKYMITPKSVTGEYAALVKIDGPIAADSAASAASLIPAIEKAFADDDARGVVIRVNSPGGSPVQSSLVFQRIRALSTEYPDREVIVVGEDLVTSGAYFIAAAAPRIVVNPSSVVGSIGVISSSWEVDLQRDFYRRFGVDRRVLIAGEHKARGEMFRPLDPDDREKIESMLEAVHKQFIAAVEEGRGSKLKGGSDALYSGDFWTGEEAVALGLADELGSMSTVLADLGVKQTKDYTPRPGIFERLSSSFGAAVGASIAQHLLVEHGPYSFEMH